MAEQTETPTIETRQEAIAAALESEGRAAGDVAGEEPTTDKKATQPEKKAETPAGTSDEDKVLAEQGRQLILALNDPAKKDLVVKFLAEEAGYVKAPTTKAEVKEIKNDILEDLKEGLGEEFSIVAERLAPAIEKILNKKMEAATADIRANIQAQESEKLQVQSAAALTSLTSDFFGADEELPAAVNTEMSKYMDRVSPNPTMTVKEYLEDAFYAAVGKLGLTKSDKVKSEKVARNRSDAPSRLASARAPQESNIRRDDSKPMSRTDAIRAAVEAAEKN